MTEMIERVAQAILSRVPRIEACSTHADQVRAQEEKFARSLACAAIEAMRTPSEAMKRAPIGEDQIDTVAGLLDDYSAVAVWQAMIDAALKE